MTDTGGSAGDDLLDAVGEARLHEALGDEWLPVAYGSEIAERPVGVTLLGVDLVIARLDGVVGAFADLCPHRGARLSLGWSVGATLQCPYHGWVFGADGRCVGIPAVSHEHIPSRARLRRFAVAETAGLVWVQLAGGVPGADAGDGRPPVAAFPEGTDPSYRLVEVAAYDWSCSVHRRIENFVDLAHLPWVHDGVLGDRGRPHTPDHHVERSGRRITMRSLVPEEINAKTSRAIEAAGATAAGPITTLQDWLIVAPVTLWWRQELSGGRHFGVLLAASPVDRWRCRTFTVLFRDFATDAADDAAILRFHLDVAEADRPIVESQRPHQLPFDLTAELHLRDTDRMSREYRRALREMADRRGGAGARTGAGGGDGPAVPVGVGRVTAPTAPGRAVQGREVDGRAAGQRRVADLPKAHLHLHLDGSFPAAAVDRVAQRRGAAVTAPREFDSVWEFFDAYLTVPAALRTLDDLRELCAALVESEAGHGVVYLEPGVEPDLYRHLGDPATVLAAMTGAFAVAGGLHAVEVGAMVVVNTDTGAEDALAAARLAAVAADRGGVTAFGLACFDEPDDWARFAPAVGLARAAGLTVVCHAGQTAGPSSVSGALDALAPDRIAHGVRSAEDPGLMSRLAGEGVVLDVCPSSNVALGVFDSLGDHSLPALVDAGVPVSLNADDEYWFGSSITAEYEVGRREFGFDDHALAAIARAPARSTGMAASTRRRLEHGADAWLAASCAAAQSPTDTPHRQEHR